MIESHAHHLKIGPDLYAVIQLLYSSSSEILHTYRRQERNILHQKDRITFH